MQEFVCIKCDQSKRGNRHTVTRGICPDCYGEDYERLPSVKKRKRQRARKQYENEKAGTVRKKYQYDYYRANIDKAKQYQRDYRLQSGKIKAFGVAHKRKREAIRCDLNVSDIAQAPTSKALKLIDDIIAGRKRLWR